uniref:Uncharacterized protein n=1 Tax=Anguilla anguilla TaxID=7936 RepID=A0A0E9XZU1_ANGAN
MIFQRRSCVVEFCTPEWLI